MAALGGFLGVDPAGTPASVGTLVEEGKLRFVLAGGPAFGFFAGVTPAIEVMEAVRSACRPADLGRWAEEGTSAPLSDNPFLSAWQSALYDCKGAHLAA